MKRIILVSFVFSYLMLIQTAQAGTTTCEDGRCINNDTRAFWGLTFTPSYKNTYEMDLLNIENSCDAEKGKITKTSLPKNSYFRQTLDDSVQTANEMTVHVYEVDEEDDKNTDTSNIELTERKYFTKPFKVCINGSHGVQKSNYKRVGGVSTGLLVVPFKLRDGDVYSDSTIGPYISYKWEVIELLASAGISQISVTEIGTDKIESKTGITAALGVNFEIHNDWDIALLVGADHLSGDTGKNWEYQDKAWFSFAIGFNFTR